MDRAKETVKKFMSNDGKHDTTVHEKVAPAVQNETIQRQEHERQTTAVDREVHQDHYHTTEQPVQHSETLPEQHHHNVAAVEHRSFEHGNADQVKSRLHDEQQRYQDSQQRVEGGKTQSHEGTVQGEHMHHHVHETIQPVVNKQTVEPHVVHTTVPIHEVHHNEAHHHASTALPPMSMDDFKKTGGTLGGREEQQTRHEFGEPQSIGGHRVQDDRGPVAGTTDHSGMDQRTTHATTERIGNDSRTNPGYGSAGQEGINQGYGSEGQRDLNQGYGSEGQRGINQGYGSEGQHSHGTPIADQMGTGSHTGQSSGLGQGTSGNTGERLGTDGHLPGSKQNDHSFGTMDGGERNAPTSSTGNTSSSGKPSLMDKLNPKVDATGDGKAGFMK